VIKFKVFHYDLGRFAYYTTVFMDIKEINIVAKRRGNNEGNIIKRNDGRWMARISIGRDPATGTLKRATFYGKTRQEVAGKLTKALHDQSRGTFVVLQKLTPGSWLDTWLREYKQPRIRPITFDSYSMLVRSHLKPALGHILLRDLRPEHVQRYYNDKAQQELESRTIRLHHVVLSNALAQAEKNQLVVRNVCRLTASPRQTRKERGTLTVGQVIAQLFPALQGDRLYAAFLTLFMMGLRRGELLGLRWQDVDLNAGTLHIRQTLVRVGNHTAQEHAGKTRLVFQEPKTETSRRIIPIPDACLAALRQHKGHQAEEKLAVGPGYQDYGLVFCQVDGKPIDPRSINLYFTQALKRAGLPAIRLHDARHTYATWLLEQGVSPKTVQTMLGHGSIAVTLDIYSHVSLDLEKQAAAKLNAVLTGAH
jgi:integrase